MNMKENALKFKLLLLILAITFHSCNKNENLIPNSPEEFRLSKILKYSNSSASKLTEEVVYTYDKVGNMIKEEFFVHYYNPTRTILERFNKFEYSGGKKTKMQIFNGEAGNPTLGLCIEYFYENNLLVRENTRRQCDNNSLVHSRNYEYDERGNLTRKYTDDPKCGITGDVKYSYDNQNRLILEENTATGINDYKYVKHIYDNSGRKTKIEYTNEKGGLIKYTEIFYKGTSQNPEKELNFDKNGKQIIKYQHYYDDLGNLIETVINDECSMFKRKYNGTLMIEEIHYWWHEYGYHGTGQMPENGMSRYEYEEF